MIYLKYRETHREYYKIYAGTRNQSRRWLMVLETKCKLSHLRKLLKKIEKVYGGAYGLDDEGCRHYSDGSASL